MSKVSVIESGKLTGKSTQTIYRYIKRGKLSKTEDGIDTSELIRVFGPLLNPDSPPRPPRSDNYIKRWGSDELDDAKEVDHLKKEVLEALRRENKLLKEQLDKADAREAKLNQRLDNLLPSPGAGIVDRIKDKFF